MELFRYEKSALDLMLFKSMDIETLEAAGVNVDEISKAMGREGMVQKEVQVTRGGQTFTRKQWVKAGDDDKKEKPAAKQDGGGKEDTSKEDAKPNDKLKQFVDQRLDKVSRSGSTIVTNRKHAQLIVDEGKKRGMKLTFTGTLNKDFRVFKDE